jgi:hypothetical protein
MAFVKQFLTKTRPSENTSIFRYAPVLPVGKVEIYALVSISNSVEAETSRFNKFVWDGFLDGFLSKDDNIIARLKNALVGAEFKLKELLRHDSVLKEKGVDLDLSVLIFKENKVFVGVLGNHKVFLYKKKFIDISELLLRNKSNVGSLLISPEDFFVNYYAKESIEGRIKECIDVKDAESFLAETFQEDSVGGAFVTILQEEKKIEVVEPVINEVKVDDQPKEVELVVEEEKFKSRVDTKKIKGFLLLIWEKLKIVFEKIIIFLSEKLSGVFEKIKTLFRNKYGRKRWFKKLQSSSSVRRFRQGIKPFKVGEYKDKELRTRRFVAFFVLLVLVFSVFLGVRSAFESRQISLLTGELNVLMEDWDSDIEKAKRKGSEDVDESLGILSGVSKELDEFLEGLKKDGRFEKLGDENNEKIENLKSSLANAEDKIFQVVPLHEDDGNISLFLDTKITFGEKSDPVNISISKGSQIVTGEMLYVIDSGEKTVFEVASDGNYRRIGDPSNLLKKPLHIDLGNIQEDEAVYVYDAESGALRAGKDEEGKFNDFKSLSGLNARALGGEGVTGFAVFGRNDSLNFLVPADSRVIRSMGFGGTTYNLPSEYMSHPSFEQGTDLFGDQYVYVLSTTPNGVKRFVPITGANSQLMVTGLREDLRSITTGYTGATMDKVLMLFDSETKRFYKFSKPIEIGENLVHPGEIVLISQYEYRGKRDDVFNDVKGIVVTDDDKSMYVLDGRRIWKVNIGSK